MLPLEREKLERAVAADEDVAVLRLEANETGGAIELPRLVSTPLSP